MYGWDQCIWTITSNLPWSVLTGRWSHKTKVDMKPNVSDVGCGCLTLYFHCWVMNWVEEGWGVIHILKIYSHKKKPVQRQCRLCLKIFAVLLVKTRCLIFKVFINSFKIIDPLCGKINILLVTMIICILQGKKLIGNIIFVLKIHNLISCLLEELRSHN